MTNELENVENKVKKMFENIEDKSITYFIKWGIIAWFVLYVIKHLKCLLKD